MLQNRKIACQDRAEAEQQSLEKGEEKWRDIYINIKELISLVVQSP